MRREMWEKKKKKMFVDVFLHVLLYLCFKLKLS